MHDALVTTAEVGEIAANDRERPNLRRARADIPGQRQRLPADRQRVGMPPGHHQAAGE
jgi:hypothetical protein